MNERQFDLIANRNIRNDDIKHAAYDVLFNGVTAYRAERDHGCPPGTVARAVKSLNSHFDYCVAVVNASEGE